MSLTFEQIKEMFPGDWKETSNEILMYHPSDLHSIHYNSHLDVWISVINLRMSVGISLEEIKKYYHKYWKFINFE